MLFGQLPACRPTQCRNLKIVAFGDSTTFGYSVTEGYPTKLVRRLAEVGILTSIVNAGVNGDTTSGGRRRLANDVLTHRADLVIVQFGLNDQTIRLYEQPATTESYVTLERFTENLRCFARILRAAGSRVILMTPNPMTWTATLEHHYPKGPYIDGPRGGNKLLRRYAEAVRVVAAEEDVELVDILQLFDEFQKRTGHNLDELFLDDGVHPNDSGYELIAKSIATTVVRTFTIRCFGANVHGNFPTLLRDECIRYRSRPPRCSYRRKISCVAIRKRIRK